MNSANAFSYAISGSFTEDTINQYADYVNNTTAMLQNMGGWLGEQAKKTLANFDNFLNSRAWEMSSRLLNTQDGEYVSRYAIGYLGSVSAIQQAQGYMRDYIMAHPAIQQEYLDGKIEGYGGDFSHFCTGVGRDNLFYRRAWNGVLNLSEEDGQAQLRHTHFHDTLGGSISWREREDLHKTYRAIDHHRLKKMFDLTSESGAGLSDEKIVEPPADE